jgi:bifunctional DNase/RNase
MTAKQAEQEVKMEVKGLMLDPSSKTPIVLLHDPVDHAYLPIWIGVFEANAIALSLEGVDPPRPMTHDLLMSTLGSLGAKVEKVTICGLKESTFFAEILVRGEAGHHLVDSRPSDAIALALRAGAPIFAHREVLENARASELVSRLTDDEKVKKWLEEASDEDFGEYEM